MVAATSCTTHDGPGSDAGLEPASIKVVVNVPVGGGEVTGEAVLVDTVPRPSVSVKPGARPVPEVPKVIAVPVITGSVLR